MQPVLARVVGLPGAVLLGLGSILGTGIFVSVGIAAGIAGPAVVLAVMLAAVVAACNGLSSAQLAASHPVSGGTYEYAYVYLHPRLGVVAGWMFLCAKSASAATAALGFAGYVLEGLGVSGTGARVAVGLAAVAVLTAVVAGGMRRSNRTNAVIVSLTLLALLTFVALGLPLALDAGIGIGIARDSHSGRLLPDLPSLFHATALMFVAYTGYGRIATLGEEVREPRKSIPRAIVITLVTTMLLYSAVAWVSVSAIGSKELASVAASTAAPLELAAHRIAGSWLAWLIATAATLAMLGVLLNLLLGLSRVLLAMARRGDMPGWLAELSERTGSPRRAVLVIGGIIAGLVCIGDVKATWSFSAFTVLVYYAITNLAALRLPASQRLYPVAIPVLGLLACASLAVWVTPAAVALGLALIALGLVWHEAATWWRRTRA